MALKGLAPFFIAFSLFALMGCDLPSPKETKDSKASDYAVSSVKGEMISINLHPSMSIPISNVYNFKACIFNLRQKKVIVGHKFTIEEIDKELSTDVNGCLNWSETIQYNFITLSKYLKFTRTITGQGNHRGQQEAVFAIDPWSHGESRPKDALDLSQHEVPAEYLIEDPQEVQKALKGQSEFQKKNAPPSSIWLEMARIYSQEDRITPNGFEITYDFQGLPQISLYKMNGEKFFYDISKGDFKATLQLLHVELKDGQKHRKLLTESHFDDLKILNKNFALNSKLNFQAPYWGHLYIGIKIEAKSAPFPLKTFEGIYYLGDHTSVKSNGWLKLNSVVQNQSAFSIENFLSGQYEEPDRFRPSTTAPEIRGQRGGREDFDGRNQITVLPLRFTAISAQGDIGHRRSIKYQVTACFEYPVREQRIRGRKFHVTQFRTKETDPVKHPAQNPLDSQQTGCITWTEEMPVEMYQCQRYIEGFIEIENNDLGLKKRIPYFVNPWLSTPEVAIDKMLIRDSVGQECDGQKEASAPRFIFIQDLRYQMQSLKNTIDRNLEPIVHRRSKIDIDAVISNNSDLLLGRGGNTPLRNGYFLVKMVLASNPEYDPEKKHRYISHSYRIFKASSGRLSGDDVEFTFHNPFDIANRNVLMVQILPAIESKVQEISDSLTGKKHYYPKGNINDYNQVIDTQVPLTPVIYEGKIMLLGSETGSVSMQDAHQDLILSQGTDLGKIKELQQSRLEIMDRLVSDGQNEIRQKQEALSGKNHLATYAQTLQHLMIDLNENSPERLKLQKVLAMNIRPFWNTSYPLNIRVLSPNDPRRTTPPSVRIMKEQMSLVNAEKLAGPERLRHWLEQDRLHTDAARKLCLYWVNEFLMPVLKKDMSRSMIRSCLTASDKTIADFFVRNKVYHVNQLERFVAQPSYAKDMEVGSNFYLDKNLSTSTSASVSTSFGPALASLSFVGLGLTASQSESESQGNSFAFSSGMYLSQQINNFKIYFKDYTVCHQIRANPQLFTKEASLLDRINPFKINFYNSLDLSQPGEKILNTLNRGLLLCWKPSTPRTLEKVETFTLIKQAPENKERQDSGDPMNRPLFIALRGKQDILRFENMMKAGLTMPSGFSLESLPSEEVNKRLLQLFHFRPTLPQLYIEPTP